MSIRVPQSIQPLPGYRLHVRFVDGVEGTTDLSALAGVGVFERWKTRPESFQDVALGEDGSIVWERELDLCSDAIYLELSGRRVEEIFPRLKQEGARA